MHKLIQARTTGTIVFDTKRNPTQNFNENIYQTIMLLSEAQTTTTAKLLALQLITFHPSLFGCAIFASPWFHSYWLVIDPNARAQKPFSSVRPGFPDLILNSFFVSHESRVMTNCNNKIGFLFILLSFAFMKFLHLLAMWPLKRGYYASLSICVFLFFRPFSQ